MSLYRRAAKRDDAEPAVVQELTRRGAKVWRLSGQDLPDLLVSFRGRWLLAEVKTGKAKLKPGQEAFRDRCGAPVALLRTPADATTWLVNETAPVVERVLSADDLAAWWAERSEGL